MSLRVGWAYFYASFLLIRLQNKGFEDSIVINNLYFTYAPLRFVNIFYYFTYNRGGGKEVSLIITIV